MADIIVAFKGWNSSAQAWGSSTWGNDNALPGATGVVGDGTTVSGGGLAPTTGLAATGAVGAVTISASASTTILGNTGVAATAVVDSDPLVVTGSSTTTVLNDTGVAGTGAVGAVTTTGSSTIAVTGVAATAVVNADPLVITGSSTTTVLGNTGVSATAVVDNGTIVSASSTTTILGDTGVTTPTQVGDPTITVENKFPVTGVSATGAVGKVLVWSRIVPNQNPSYTPEQPTQSPGWSGETPTQSPGWTRTAA